MTDDASPGAQRLDPQEPPRPIRSERIVDPPVVSMPTIVVTVIVVAVFGALLLPSIHGHRGDHRLARDCNNLKQLWTMQANYMVSFGGRDHRMPPDTGSEFWTSLTKTTPPLIDASLDDIYDCPLSPALGSAENCEYRGPASDVNAYDDGDPVGADLDGSHGPGQGGIVLRKSGDVMNYAASDPLWQSAAERTAP